MKPHQIISWSYFILLKILESYICLFFYGGLKKKQQPKICLGHKFIFFHFFFFILVKTKLALNLKVPHLIKTVKLGNGEKFCLNFNQPFVKTSPSMKQLITLVWPQLYIYIVIALLSNINTALLNNNFLI